MYAELGPGRALLDDRQASAGVKFADADLLGMPTRVVVGAKGLARGVAEVTDRTTQKTQELAIEGAAASL